MIIFWLFLVLVCFYFLVFLLLSSPRQSKADLKAEIYVEGMITMALQKQQDDLTGNWHWFEGYGPKKTKGAYIGPCPHKGRAVIAHGPDLRHYTLDECTECNCRAWFTDKETRSTPWLEMMV